MLPLHVLSMQVYVCERPEHADAVLALRSKLKSNTALRAVAKDAGVPIYAIKTSSASNLVRAFRTLLGVDPAAGGVFSKSADLADNDLLGGNSGSASARRGSVLNLGGSDGSSSDDWDSDGEGVDEGESNDLTPDGDKSTLKSTPASGGVHPYKSSDEADALEEARLAIEHFVIPLLQPVELLPRTDAVRDSQAQLLKRYNLDWEVVGEGVHARLRVLPKGGNKGVKGGKGDVVEAEETSDLVDADSSKSAL